MILTVLIIHKWKTRQVDFVLAFLQADIECPVFMELPKGTELRGKNNKSHMLHLLKNLYGKKKAGRVWNQHLHAKLHSIGFAQSSYDDCLYFRGKTIFAVYVDDKIFVSPETKNIDGAIHELRKSNYDIDNQGNLNNYLGVNIRVTDDGVLLTQPHLIDQIIEDTGISTRTQDKLTPVLSMTILSNDPNSKAYDHKFDYRSVVGKLNFLEKSTRPDIAYVVHQCARFCSNPKKSHGDTVVHLVKYLRHTKTNGLLLKPS